INGATLVMNAFVGPKAGRVVNHINGVKTDDRLDNLEYTTIAENNIHSRRVLLRCVGAQHWKSKVTDDQVREIRRLYATGLFTQDALGRQFGIRQGQVSAIVLKVRWKHVA
ncbi:MAG: HNH endonuclease, partial [Deltaproteobacteria bacterium]|nr:HNH endonuclease [Deltaproteobacteria bacterium]